MERQGVRPRRPGAARRVEGRADGRGREGVHDDRLLAPEITTTFTTQNESLPVQDDFVALHARRQAVRDRERSLREDVQSRPRLRAQHLRRRRQAHDLPRERLPGRGQEGELLRGELHAERSRGVPHGRSRQVPRRDGRRDRGLPADPQPQREPHPRRRQARSGAGGRVLHARRDDRHLRGRGVRGGQVPARPRHEPVLPAPPRAAGRPIPSSCSRRTRSRPTC